MHQVHDRVWKVHSDHSAGCRRMSQDKDHRSRGFYTGRVCLYVLRRNRTDVRD